MIQLNVKIYNEIQLALVNTLQEHHSEFINVLYIYINSESVCSRVKSYHNNTDYQYFNITSIFLSYCIKHNSSHCLLIPSHNYHIVS